MDNNPKPKQPKLPGNPTNHDNTLNNPGPIVNNSDKVFANGQTFKAGQTNTGKQNFIKTFVHRLKNTSKKQRIVIGIVVFVVLVAGGATAYALTRPQSEPTPAPAVEVKKEEPKKEPTLSKLTGLEVKPEINNRPVISVQIENSLEARPQASLIDAGVVFEAIAEGGITRFNANYLDKQPDYIGPIRSARPYYVEFTAPFDPVFVHAGGSALGLQRIAELGLKDIDHGPNGGAFIRSSDRFSPHNLYTSTANLDVIIERDNFDAGKTKSFKRKKENKKLPTKVAKVNLNISSSQYNVEYQYQKKSNSYNRIMGGVAHTDHKSGKQISPKVVVAMITDYSTEGIYSVYRTTGVGDVFIFQDGQVQKGKWKRSAINNQYSFTNSKGQKISLNPGQTWFTFLGGADQVVY